MPLVAPIPLKGSLTIVVFQLIADAIVDMLNSHEWGFR